MEKHEIIYPDSPRIGKFNIPYELLRNGADRPMLQALFGLCVILDAGAHESGRGKQFIAACDLFQELAEGEEIPEYRIEFAAGMAFPDAEHEVRRTNNGPFGFVAVRQTILRVPAMQFSHSAQSLH